jgi:VanZ family protein
LNDTRLAGRLALAWAVIVLAFAVVPTHAVLSATVGGQEDLTTRIGHFAEFAVLAWLLAGWASGRVENGWRAAALAWTTAVAYGAVIEVLQMPLSYRSAQWSDLATDAAGAAVGVLAFRCGLGWAAPGARTRAR